MGPSENEAVKGDEHDPPGKKLCFKDIAETSILSEGKKKKKRTWAIVQVKSLPLQQDYRPKASGFCLCT